MMNGLGRPLIFCAVLVAIALLSTAPCISAQSQLDPQPQVTQPETAQAQTDQPQQPEAQSGTQSSEQATRDQKFDPANAPSTLQSDQGTKDRLFFALPNFLTLENSSHVPPMTVGQKFKVATRSSFDYSQYPWYGLLAGISQAQNSEPGYGQGAQGYAKRYAAAFADGTIENYMVNAVVPSVLHTDPRYFQMGRGGFVKRTGYALSRLFVTRTDSGHETFNVAEIGGSFAGAAISNYSYHPEADKNLHNTLSVWGTQVAYDGLRIVLNEFWPDIRRKFHRDRSQIQP